MANNNNDDGSLLPPGWSCHVSSKTGKSYFFNCKTGVSVWSFDEIPSMRKRKEREERKIDFDKKDETSHFPNPGLVTNQEYEYDKYSKHFQEERSNHKVYSTDGGSIGNSFDSRNSEREQDVKDASLDIEDENGVFCSLDEQNSDLNLVILDGQYSAQVMTQARLGHLWAKTRASLGVSSGRVCYEVRTFFPSTFLYIAAIQVRLDGAAAGGRCTRAELRCGWTCSGPGAGISYYYSSRGRKCEESRSSRYGSKYGEGDVIGCYLDMENYHVIISYTLNGVGQGTAFVTSRAGLEGRPLFPHLHTLNQSFSVNFGQLVTPLCPLLPGFLPIGRMGRGGGQVAGPDRVGAGRQLVMMVGLPGAGNTYWAQQLVSHDHLTNYTILGVENILLRISDDSLTTVLTESDSACSNQGKKIRLDLAHEYLSQLINIASKTQRNFILDMANVCPIERRRKMQLFAGFECRAVVVVPSDGEYKRRLAAKVRGRALDPATILREKSCFVLPTEEEGFSSVVYTELGREDARLLVSQYNAEAALNFGPAAAEEDLKGTKRRKEKLGGRRQKQKNRPSVDVECIYWQRGHCEDGMHCKYIHSL